jgi:hypothetical protein
MHTKPRGYENCPAPGTEIFTSARRIIRICKSTDILVKFGRKLILVHQGQNVTLFVTGNAILHATLESVHRHGIYLDLRLRVKENRLYNLLQLDKRYRQGDGSAPIHAPTDWAGLPTANGSLTLTCPQKLLGWQPLVRISHDQQNVRSDVNRLATVDTSIDSTQLFGLQPRVLSWLMCWGQGFIDRDIAVVKWVDAIAHINLQHMVNRDPADAEKVLAEALEPNL